MSQSVAPGPVSITWLLTKNVLFSGLGPDLPFSETLGSGGGGGGEREKGEGSWSGVHSHPTPFLC